jgi:nitrite reductase/ring-hydroxylating ferredoxin subunit
VRELSILKPLAGLEHAVVLDPVIRRVHSVVDALLKPRALEDVLHGVPAGHPVHPAIVLVPAGTWIGAAVLDALPGTGRASRTLVGVGVLAAAPAILTGWADWARTRREQQRVGIVHAAANETAWTLYAASWVARRAGHEGVGRVLGYLGFGLVGFGGYLGGHLAYRQATGANHANAVLTRFPDGWHTLGLLEDLPQEVPVRRDLAGEPLFVLRRGGRVDVLADVSTHLGEPLSDGLLEDPGHAAATITTTYGSVFDIRTGEVVHGPATAPAIHFESRINGELVEVRLPRP